MKKATRMTVDNDKNPQKKKKWKFRTYIGPQVTSVNAIYTYLVLENKHNGRGNIPRKNKDATY